MRFRKHARWLLVLALVLTFAAQVPTPVAKADDLQQKLDATQKELDEINRQRQETRNALADVTFQAKEAQLQLNMVEGELTQANDQLAVIDGQLTTTTAELNKVEADLAEMQVRFDAKKDAMGSRIRSIRENGRVDYLSVLFGATSFRDFIGRLDLLAMILKRDREMFDEIKADKLVLEQRQQEVADRKNRLATLKLQAEQYRNTVAVKRSEHEQISRSLQESRRTLEVRMADFDAHTEALTAQVAEIVREMNRQGGRFAPIPPVRPVILTDTYGMRDHPILIGQYRMHWGTDFSARMGQAVYAIEDGVVISTKWDDAFGNLVIVDHGGGITSWYAHNSRILVKVNDTVKQGQQLAEAGSTGWSTGPHVHLEIHVNGDRKDPMSYISAQ